MKNNWIIGVILGFFLTISASASKKINAERFYLAILAADYGDLNSCIHRIRFESGDEQKIKENRARAWCIGIFQGLTAFDVLGLTENPSLTAEQIIANCAGFSNEAGKLGQETEWICRSIAGALSGNCETVNQSKTSIFRYKQRHFEKWSNQICTSFSNGLKLERNESCLGLYPGKFLDKFDFERELCTKATYFKKNSFMTFDQLDFVFSIQNVQLKRDQWKEKYNTILD